MSRDTEIILRLGASLCIQESIGRWDNAVTYSEPNGNQRSCQYSIQVFADYHHAVYHLGIGIAELADGFEKYAEHIIRVGHTIADDVSQKKLRSVPMHFSGLVLIGADKININKESLLTEFGRLGMAIRVYDASADDMPAVVPRIMLTPADSYSRSFEDCVIHYQTPDYLIWEEQDGSVAYSLQMRLRERFQDETEVLRDISKLSQSREKVTRFLHSKGERRRVAGGMASVLRDALEGKIDDANATLQQLEEKAFKESLGRAKAITLLVIIGIMGASLLTVLVFTSFQKAEFVAPVWGMLGASLALWMPISRSHYLAEYSWWQIVVDVLARLAIGGVAGIVVIFLVQSQVLLGFIDAEGGGLIYVVALAAGWSERVLPKLFGELESRMLAETK